MRFRELPILTGRFPRQFHNVLHDTGLPPDLPTYDVMQYYCDHYYHLANLHESAHNTLEARRQFAVRKADVARNPWRLGNRAVDTTGISILSREHERHHMNYRQRITEHQEQELQVALFEYVDYERLEVKKPHIVRKALRPLGQIAADNTINFLPKLPLRAA